METIITWAMTYSPPVLALFIAGEAMIFVIRLSVEKTVDYHFQQQNKLLAFAMERRSRFDEMVYCKNTTRLPPCRLGSPENMIELRRHFHVIDVPGLFGGNNIPSLTDFFREIADYHFALTDRLHDIPYKEAQLALRFAQSAGKDMPAFNAEQEALQKEFRKLMNREFGLDQISYSAPELEKFPGLPRPARPIQVAPQSESPGAERS